ncbi:FERM domain-containing protein 4A isoform X1 [Aix galericulata]|nr:FERM domain-containing protein 4A isoform X1 [Aix galericulata]
MALGACTWPSDSSPGAARVWTVGVNQRRETELQLTSPAPGGSLEDETGQGRAAREKGVSSSHCATPERQQGTQGQGGEFLQGVNRRVLSRLWVPRVRAPPRHVPSACCAAPSPLCGPHGHLEAQRDVSEAHVAVSCLTPVVVSGTRGERQSRLHLRLPAGNGDGEGEKGSGKGLGEREKGKKGIGEGARGKGKGKKKGSGKGKGKGAGPGGAGRSGAAPGAAPAGSGGQGRGQGLRGGASPPASPPQIFQWRQLENLYFREKKFSVEVHDPRRASVTRRTFGHSGIAVHTWYACPALIKSIWAMAISQHQFYLDRKQSKSKIHAARSLSEIAIDLTETGTLKTSKLANMGSKGKIISGSSGSLLSSGSQESDSSQSAKKDMLAALKSRQEALEETLRQRLEELKKLCLREAELTGKLPREYPLDPGEEPPIVRRRIGTAFKLDEQKILPKGEEAELERLEREFAIQSQITEAARRLASDPNVSKKLKKQRKTSYLNALKKLQEIENAINEYRIKSGKKPTQRASLIIDEGNIASEDSSLSDALVLEDEDSQVTSTISPLQSPHKGLPPRPPLHNRPPPPQSLEGLRQMHYHRNDYDKSPIKPKMWSESSLDEPYEKVKKRSSHGHASSHKRFPSTGSCAEAGGSSSLQNSPIRSLPHWNSQSSMPSTPDLRVRSPHYVHSTRSVDISPTRLHSLAQHFRHRSSSLESQGKLLGSENETGSPDFYTPRTRSSNGSDPMDDCSSCTSHSSSEHYYPAQMNPNYSTLAEDSPSKARERQRQRHKSAGNLASSNSGSMPNLAARNGTGHHRVYLHSQSQPSSQYRIKEYPLYIEGSSTPVVVRSLENDQEGHYSVKAQFKTSNSYTAGGMFKENWHGDEADSVRLTPSRSQIIRTPSLGREGHEKGSGRTAVSDELRLWYQRSTASHKEHSRLSHTSSTSSDSSSQYSTSSQSTFVAHSRVTRMPQMCKATSAGRVPAGLKRPDPRPLTSPFLFSPPCGCFAAALPHSQRSSTPSSELAATPPGSPHHILAWQTG